MVYLSGTDTTVGLLSQNLEALNKIKSSPKSKRLIKVVDSLYELKKHTRVPKQFNTMIRRANKTTFILKPNLAIRVNKNIKHNRFLKKLSWTYSTSANLSGKNIDLQWANLQADITINFLYLQQQASSKIIKIKNNRVKRVR